MKVPISSGDAPCAWARGVLVATRRTARPPPEAGRSAAPTPTASGSYSSWATPAPPPAPIDSNASRSSAVGRVGDRVGPGGSASPAGQAFAHRADQRASARLGPAVWSPLGQTRGSVPTRRALIAGFCARVKAGLGPLQPRRCSHAAARPAGPPEPASQAATARAASTLSRAAGVMAARAPGLTPGSSPAGRSRPPPRRAARRARAAGTGAPPRPCW